MSGACLLCLLKGGGSEGSLPACTNGWAVGHAAAVPQAAAAHSSDLLCGAAAGLCVAALRCCCCVVARVSACWSDTHKAVVFAAGVRGRQFDASKSAPYSRLVNHLQRLWDFEACEVAQLKVWLAHRLLARENTGVALLVC